MFTISRKPTARPNSTLNFIMGAASMDHKLACDAMKEYAETRLHCSVSIKNLSSISLRGFYLRGENKLVLSDKLNDTQRLSSGLHELSHAILRHSPTHYRKTRRKTNLKPTH